MSPPIRWRLDDAERTARQLPHREKYLQLAVGFMRGLLELHLELVDQVERELAKGNGAGMPTAINHTHDGRA
jgi:hypothetical protein